MATEGFGSQPSHLVQTQLVEQLVDLVSKETQAVGDAWIRIDKLTQLFFMHYKSRLATLVKQHSLGGDVKDFLQSSRVFAIYSTPNPQEFYVALLKDVVPGSPQPSSIPIPYKIKRPWKLDGRISKMLKERPFINVDTVDKHQPISSLNMPSKIESKDDLAIALTELIQFVSTRKSGKSVSISELSNKFHDYYDQPIRTAVREVCPHMKLIELLKTIPSLQVQQTEHEWQIQIRAEQTDK